MIRFRWILLLALIFAGLGIVGTWDLEQSQMEASSGQK
jgi:hypothetical protein